MKLTGKEMMESQLTMPGVPTSVDLRLLPSYREASLGQKVVYIGKIGGGPRYGSQGVLTRTLRRRAVVDMGRSGTWHIPYFFLAESPAA